VREKQWREKRKKGKYSFVPQRITKKNKKPETGARVEKKTSDRRGGKEQGGRVEPGEFENFPKGGGGETGKRKEREGKPLEGQPTKESRTGPCERLR